MLFKRTNNKPGNNARRIAPALPLIAGLAIAGCSEQDFVINVQQLNFRSPQVVFLSSTSDRASLEPIPGLCIQVGGEFSMDTIKPDKRLPIMIGCNGEKFVTMTPNDILHLDAKIGSSEGGTGVEIIFDAGETGVAVVVSTFRYDGFDPVPEDVFSPGGYAISKR